MIESITTSWGRGIFELHAQCGHHLARQATMAKGFSELSKRVCSVYSTPSSDTSSDIMFD